MALLRAFTFQRPARPSMRVANFLDGSDGDSVEALSLPDRTGPPPATCGRPEAPVLTDRGFEFLRLPQVPPARADVPLMDARMMRWRALIVDDDAVMRRAVTRVLDQFETTECDSAERALSLVRAGLRFDAIICDMRMPQLGGDGFLAELAAIDPLQASRVVLLSGDARGSTRLPVDVPWLEKPFSFGELVVLVECIARR